MFVYQKDTHRIPIKVWMSQSEFFSDKGMVEQLDNLANLPFAFHHIVLTPDGHQGFGMPIGGVLATEGVVVPSAVGTDIGCGMAAVKTSASGLSLNKLKAIKDRIETTIPLGKKGYEVPADEAMMPKLPVRSDKTPILVIEERYEPARYQLGTLGGGNHFIEIQAEVCEGVDEKFWPVWVMIHSGSRNLGKRVCDHYDALAKQLNDRWYSIVPASSELAFLPIETPEAKLYITEMNYALEYAAANRRVMLDSIKEILWQEIGCSFYDEVNIHHNYCSWENHYKKNVLVHRKGATRAREGELGIIPGSQGTASYIVKGKGNPESFMSCSHGAGRALGRKEAIRKLDLASEAAALDAKGILHTIQDKVDLQEAPSSYKDIDLVMANQVDLVDIVHKLVPLAVVKGQEDE